jgi:hypothetical protein
LGDFGNSSVNVTNAFVKGGKAFIAEPRFGSWDAIDQISDEVEAPTASSVSVDRPASQL